MDMTLKFEEIFLESNFLTNFWNVEKLNMNIYVGVFGFIHDIRFFSLTANKIMLLITSVSRSRS